MARPKRGNYATGAAGQERYKKALREYLKKQKESRAQKTKITSTKENIAKQKATNKKAATTTKTKATAKSKTTAKPKATTTKAQTLATGKTSKAKTTAATTTTTTRRKTTTTKPKTTAKKPAGKVPARKPIISNKQKLQIKKAGKKVIDTGKKVVGSTKKNISKIKTEGKKFINKPSPTKRPTTAGQKFASQGNQLLKKGGKYLRKQVIPKAKKDLLKIGKGILKDPKSVVKGAKGLGISYVAEKALNQIGDRAIKQLNPKTRGNKMTLKEYRADLAQKIEKRNKEDREKYGPLHAYYSGYAKAFKKLRKNKTNDKQSSTTKNINKQKKTNNQKVTNPKSEELKIAKQRVKKAKGWNKQKLQREVDYLKKFGKQPRTWQNPYGAKGKGKPSTVKTDTSTKSAKPGSARAKMIAKNEARFGKARVDKLRSKNQDFQAMKKKKMTKAEFIRKYPNSITAQKAKGLRR